MAFPNAVSTGIPYKHFRKLPRDYGKYTDDFEYEDGGMDFNRRTSNPPHVWEIEFLGGRSAAETAQFDTFWDSVGTDNTFDFVDPDGVTWTNVRVKSYSRDHRQHFSWLRDIAFTLIKYP
jgi:hypothetical protein